MADIKAGHFFAGVIGLSLVRNWYVDAEFNEARMSELGQLLANLDTFPHSLVLNPEERELLEGYHEWASSYDGVNPLVDAEEPVVRPILQRLSGPGVKALDAACGTGRHAALLVELGCETTAIDQSSAMLDVARLKLPSARFEEGDIRSMPFDDGEFDLAIISLALCHFEDPADAVRELSRVLRVGGTLVVTDPHPFGAVAGGQAFYGGIVPGQPMKWVRNYCHSASTWFTAFKDAGLQVEQCLEPPFAEAQIMANPTSFVFPEAARASASGLAAFWVWVVSKS